MVKKNIRAIDLVDFTSLFGLDFFKFSGPLLIMFFFQVKDTLYKFWVLNFRLRDWGRDRSDNNSRSSKHGLHSCRIFEPKLNEDFRDSGGGGGGGGNYVFSIFFK